MSRLLVKPDNILYKVTPEEALELGTYNKDLMALCRYKLKRRKMKERDNDKSHISDKH